MKPLQTIAYNFIPIQAHSCGHLTIPFDCLFVFEFVVSPGSPVCASSPGKEENLSTTSDLPLARTN